MSQDDWAVWYSENRERYNKTKHKIKKDHLRTCRICFSVYPESLESQHETLHNPTPDVTQEYTLDCNYKQANNAIAEGGDFIGLFVKDVCLLYDFLKERKLMNDGYLYCLTWFNALLLPDNYRLKDIDNTAIKWNERKRKFIRCLWLLALAMIIL